MDSELYGFGDQQPFRWDAFLTPPKRAMPAMVYCRALIRLNSAIARSNLWLKSHIASRISRKVADVLARSARPYAKMLLFRRYPMILGSEILESAKLPDLRAALVGDGMIWMSSKSFI